MFVCWLLFSSNCERGKLAFFASSLPHLGHPYAPPTSPAMAHPAPTTAATAHPIPNVRAQAMPPPTAAPVVQTVVATDVPTLQAFSSQLQDVLMINSNKPRVGNRVILNIMNK